MKPNMKKKFDFSAEMNEAEAMRISPKNDFLEEEKRLLDLNVKELAKLNDNVHELRINLVNLTDFMSRFKPEISHEMQQQAEQLGNSLLRRFIDRIEAKCKDAEHRMRQAENFISIPTTAFYILIILLVSLFSFFASIIVANAEILHSALVWKAAGWSIFIAVLGTAIALVIPKILDRWK